MVPPVCLFFALKVWAMATVVGAGRIDFSLLPLLVHNALLRALP